MKNSILYYSVGALLYCPANNDTIVHSIINQKFGSKFSLALCLEDTINNNCVPAAENELVSTLRQLHEQLDKQSFYLPKIFIRVRNSGQITRLINALGESSELITGFILPKFSPENAGDYIHTIIKANEASGKPFYIMPIYENACIIDLKKRYDILYSLKDQLSQIEELVLNIRVGGNDLCHMFGFRRHDTESIHQIKPIANIFSDIITVYGTDYVISGPVWEYYNGSNWKQGLLDEIADDKLCGFTGKTVIHPNQIDVVNDAYRVSKRDYEDAKSILNFDPASSSLVSANPEKERMNEYKTHSNWAMQTLLMAEVFGIR